MGKKMAFLHVGPPVAGISETHALLTAESIALDDAGLAVPEVTSAMMFHAGLEILRRHKAEGLRRRDVEGAWASVCHAAERTRSDVVLSGDQLAGATSDQIALLLDGLAAFRVHVVVTLSDSDAEQAPGDVLLDDRVGPWGAHLKPHRLHVLHLTEGDLSGLVQGIAAVALREKEAALQKKIGKLERKRTGVRRRLARVS